MILTIPLAWLQLQREKVRLLVAVAGIAFAVILMMIQLGFRDALFNSAVKVHQNLNADVVMVSTQTPNLVGVKSFSRRRLQQALGFTGVRAISPMYLSFTFWHHPLNGKTWPIFVVGFEPATQVFNLPEVIQSQSRLKSFDVVLFDELSRAEFGPVAKLFRQGKTVTTEVAEQRITVGGLFKLGASFGADSHLLTSDSTFLHLFPDRAPGAVDLGLISVEPGVNIPQLIQQMKAQLPRDVRIFAKADFITFERSFWQNHTAIGFVFNLGTLIGFMVGTMIVYQVLYTDVSDHLPEYATLKAMGYHSRYLYGVVMQESLILSLLGYLPGCLFSFGMYALMRQATALPVEMSWDRVIMVLILTVIMCGVSGAIAMRRVQSADPADIY
jgi:putative ABC transport system permease protein